MRARLELCTGHARNSISHARSFSLKKIVICFDSCKFLLLTYLSQKKINILKHLIHYFQPLLYSTLLNIPAVVTAEMFTKGKNLVINSVVYCKTAPAADPNFLLFFVRVFIQMGITEQL